MKFFLDTANLSEIESCVKKGFLSGITTNPSILSKEPDLDLIKHMIELTQLAGNLPVSVEVLTSNPKEMLSQAKQLRDLIDYGNLNIKIPIGWEELEVIYQLSKEGIAVNCTCLFTEGQCILAANAGAKYVSIFYGRTRDIGGNPLQTIENARNVFDLNGTNAEIIVGSIRHTQDIVDAQIAGAHIVTASTSLFTSMAMHPQTTKSVTGFLQDFKKAYENCPKSLKVEL